jgi:quercetin dioxygenase-like cupin family protein
MRVIVSGNETGGRYSLVELRERQGGARPLHLHTREDQFIYVLEGRVTVFLGEEEHDCPVGSYAVLPRGREHTFRVQSPDARLLILMFPAGLENAYAELIAPSDGNTSLPPVRTDLERQVTVLARYGVEITGPTPD